jgi:uncharacterized protein YciI
VVAVRGGHHSRSRGKARGEDEDDSIETFEDPVTQGSMGIFASREAAEEFATNDPFVLNGVVAGWEIRGWNEALASP